MATAPAATAPDSWSELAAPVAGVDEADGATEGWAMGVLEDLMRALELGTRVELTG